MYSVFRKEFNCLIEAEIGRFQGASNVLMVKSNFPTLESAVKYSQGLIKSGKHVNLVVKKESKNLFDNVYGKVLVDIYWDQNILECCECYYPLRMVA